MTKIKNHYILFLEEIFKKEDNMATSETVIWNGKTYWVDKGGSVTETGPNGTKHHVSTLGIQDVGARFQCDDAIKKMKAEEDRRNNSFSPFGKKNSWEI